MNNIKTFARHQKLIIKQKLGKSIASVDPEYDALYIHFEKFDKHTKNLHKLFQQVIENSHSHTSILNFISQEIKDQTNHLPIAQSACIRAQNLVTSVEQSAVQVLQLEIQQDCLDPLGSFLVLCPPVQELINSRGKYLIEYDSWREKVRKLTEKPGKDPLALPRAKEHLTKSQEDFNIINEKTKEAMRTVIDQHAAAVEPLLDRFLGHIRRYYYNLYNCSGNINNPNSFSV